MDSSSELNKEKTESNKIESKDIFKNLKNDFFLQKLFYNLSKKKTLDIIKYNNKIKERINICIKDYKEYSEIYSSIEIEIKPMENKYGRFINIKEGDEEYYHIYYNDNKKEQIKSTSLNENDKVSKINIIIDYQVESFCKLFYDCYCIESICFKKFYRNNITNMCSLFDGCSSLKELNLNNFNTNNVTDMSCMFSKCSDELKLKLKSKFNEFKEEAFEDYED